MADASSSPVLSKSAVQLSIPANMRLRPEQLDVSKNMLGQGGFAKVMQGVLTTTTAATPIPVAVKVMNKAQVSRGTFSSLQNEVDICATLRHPCLINTHGILEDADHIYIVMDLAEGGELFKYTQKFGLEDMPIVAPNFVGEVVLGLEYMQSQGVIHRDIKPENLLLTTDYHVKISDFGTVCRVDDATSNRFTGTPFYVSPEMLSTGQASAASDLWALGCVVFQLFVGRPPFQGESQYLVMQSIKERQLEFPPYFPADARSLVDRLLDPNPATRLGSGGAAGIAELKGHPFFKSVKWGTILSQPNITHLNANYTKQWEAFLLRNEQVIYASKIVKERYQLLPTSAKQRMLILTDYPRLFYLEPESLVIKGQVPWSSSIYAQSDSQERFTVVTPERSYIFVDSEKRAPLWAAKINDQVKRKK
jgi:3-phosphoinositide dependent protein kinase-1